jgi:uncharacterized protein (TIGR02147 family)
MIAMLMIKTRFFIFIPFVKVSSNIKPFEGFTIILLLKHQRVVNFLSMNVFTYASYITYLKDKIFSESEVRGYHAKISKEAGLHPSYLSRVISEATHLTPEQAAGLCYFWKFDKDQTSYYMLLVHHARAGTALLKKFIEEDIQALRNKYNNLGERLPAEKMNLQTENIYYSAWYYSAIHTLLMIPEYQTETALIKKLNFSSIEIGKILTQLESLNLIKKSGSKWITTKNNIHLSNQSWMAAVHHVNWRTKITDKIQFRNPDDLHYTGLHSLSKKDVIKIKNILMDTLVEVDRTIRPSKEEEICYLMMDWGVL